MASELQTSIARLGWDIISHLKNEDSQKGYLVSPLSITVAIAMLAGAAGPTQKTELCSKLGISDASTLSSTFESTMSTLAAQAGHSLEIANAVFLEDAVSPKSNYVEFLKSFSAELQSYPSLAAETDRINGWISDHTNGLIKNMLQKDVLANAEVLLVNAIAFKGLWSQKFKVEDTKNAYPFHVTESTTRPVSIMFLKDKKISFADLDDCVVVRLPYETTTDQTIWFEAYLPNVGKTIEDIAESIHHQSSKSRPETISTFGIPRFELETISDITPILEALGYPLHGRWPELSGTTSGPSSDLILHKAVIKVDEEGTVAAAATGVMKMRSMIRVAARDIILDRPFLYTIKDDSGLILFTGYFT